MRSYFDGIGRTTSIKYFLDNQVYAVETYTYNYLNLKATYTDPLGYTYHYEYDSKGRSVKTINPDGTSRTAQYDDINNVIVFSDENQHIKKMKVDWKNRILWVQEFSDSSTSYLAQYEYDQSGNLIFSIDANLGTTRYEYNVFGPVMITYLDGTTEQYAYDDAGNIISRTDASGNITIISYDDISRLLQILSPSGTISFEYDANGNRISMTDPTGISQYGYDNRDRLISESRSADGITYIIQSEYDAASRLTSITYPDSTVITFLYDDLNRMTSISGYAQYNYNAKSQVQSIMYQNGIETDITYGCMCGRLTQLHIEKNGSELLNLSYTYDAAGNTTQREKRFFNPVANELETSNEFYSFDWLNRLTFVSTDGGSSSYQYDERGNRVSADGVQCIYNSMNELLSMTDGTTFSYDLNGNMVSRASSSTWTYQYNAFDQLTQVTRDGEFFGQYNYDGDGRRIKKTEWVESLQAFESFISIYSGISVLYEKNTSTGMDAITIYGPTGRTARKAGSSIFYYHTDHLNSTHLITDGNGTVVTAVEYEPFGGPETEGDPEKYLFTGKEGDATNLYYFGARYYDPEIGRFITRDPEFGELIHPQSLNRYTYCLNNPLLYQDIWGLSPSGGGDKCTCASDPDVMDLLENLDTVNQQLDYLEKNLDKDLEQLFKTEADRARCVEILKEVISLEGPFNRAFDYIIPIGGALGFYLAVNIPKKYLLFIANKILVVWGITIGGVATYCLFHYNNKSSLHKTILAYTAMIGDKREQKAGMLKDLWDKCPCAVPEEEGGHQSEGGSIS